MNTAPVTVSVFTDRVGVDPYNRTSDPCQVRHGGNINSMIAWERIREHIDDIHEEILREYTNSPVPLSPKEICQKWGKHPSDISGRFTELKHAGALVPTGERFEGSGRLMLTERWIENILASNPEVFNNASKPKAKEKPATFTFDGWQPEDIQVIWDRAKERSAKEAGFTSRQWFAILLNADAQKRVHV